MKLRERLNPFFEFILPVRFHESLNETGCIRIGDPEPLFHRLMTEGQSQMGLPYSRRPQEDNILRVMDKPQRHQIPDHRRIKGWLETNIEILESILHRKTSQSHPELKSTLLFTLHLLIQEIVEDFQGRPLFLCSDFEGVIQERLDRRQFETIQIIMHPLVDQT